MTKAIAFTYNVTQTYQSYIIKAVLISCGFLLTLYALNVYAVISHTVAVESLEKQSAALSTSVDSLDAKYLELSSKATPDALADYGYIQGQVSAFISRTTSLGSLATRAHEL